MIHRLQFIPGGPLQQPEICRQNSEMTGQIMVLSRPTLCVANMSCIYVILRITSDGPVLEYSNIRLTVLRIVDIPQPRRQARR